MNKTDFYVALVSYIKSGGEHPFKPLFDLYEQFKPSCSLSDVNELFNEVGTPIHFRVCRRIVDAAHTDIRDESMRATDQWVLVELHKLLVPGFPYANSQISINAKDFEFREISVQYVIKSYFRKLKTFCFGSK